MDSETPRVDAWLKSLNTIIENPSENYRAVGAAIAIVVVLFTIIILMLIALALPEKTSPATAAPAEAKPRPRVRWSMRFLGCGVTIVVILVGTALAAVAWYRSTSSSDYCGRSCHQMSDAAASWATSTHSNIPCIRCHEGQGRSEVLRNAATRLSCLYLHLTNAQSPERPVPPSRCLSCHTGLLDTELTAVNGETFVHRVDAPESESDCGACHGKQGHE